jgi:hypothetical protein
MNLLKIADSSYYFKEGEAELSVKDNSLWIASKH